MHYEIQSNLLHSHILTELILFGLQNNNKIFMTHHSLFDFTKFHDILLDNVAHTNQQTVFGIYTI